jgi:Divergent InlB B-repeat domain
MTTDLMITAAAERVKLDGQNRAEITFTVTNSGPQPNRVVFETLPGDGADGAWFSVEEPQRRVDAGASVSYLVRIAVPTGTAAGSYTLQGRAYSADAAPEESSRLSARVAFDIAPSTKPTKPWWPYAVAAGLVLVVLAVVGWVVLRGDGKPTGTLTVDVSGNGSVSSSPTGISCPSGCQANYPIGTAVTLTATPASSATFGSWQNCPAPNGTSCQLTIKASAQTVTATFAVATWTINVQVFPGFTGGRVTATGGRTCAAECNFTYPVGTAVTLTAVPAPGFRFDGWAGACNTPTGRNNPTCTLTFNQNTGVRAVFVPAN